MDLNEVEILLIEDNTNEAEFTMRALKQYNLVNNLVWLKDGEEALDFIFAQGQYSGRSIEEILRVQLFSNNIFSNMFPMIIPQTFYYTRSSAKISFLISIKP